MVHPSVEPYVNACAPSRAPSVARERRRAPALRESALANRGDPQAVESIREVELALDGRTLRARLYVPLGDESKALVSTSTEVGSSWATRTHDALVASLFGHPNAIPLGRVPIGAGHPFPAGIDDASTVSVTCSRTWQSSMTRTSTDRDGRLRRRDTDDGRVRADESRRLENRAQV